MGFVLKKKNHKKEKVVFSIRIDRELAEQIEKAITNTEISRNEFISQAIAYALQNMEIDSEQENQQ
ncbi:ribbon-helix-helix protein, CopG family [uncultured Negativibacillus sp.]|uniref:ribbon-helix-helix protein, CopG family n=1 Tax=uncultured Negativibacillus sp. TaxID=1980696 RepID=UPI0025E5A473|nr:ribbon-helix-helix protein, CopG family [uncultured Negativibacillus sp.]